MSASASYFSTHTTIYLGIRNLTPYGVVGSLAKVPAFHNPKARGAKPESVPFFGCLCKYDVDKGQHVGLLVQRWEVRDPKNWIFYLRKNNRFHDGSPVTADDVVHSNWRTRNDPLSKQRQNIPAIASEAALDK